MKSIILALSLAACASTAAVAQDQPPPPGRGAFMEACGADLQNFCASAQNRDDRRACVMANKDRFSDSCKAFMANHPMHQHAPNQNGQMQGVPPPPPGEPPPPPGVQPPPPPQ